MPNKVHQHWRSAISNRVDIPKEPVTVNKKRHYWLYLISSFTKGITPLNGTILKLGFLKMSCINPDQNGSLFKVRLLVKFYRTTWYRMTKHTSKLIEL